MAGEPFVGEKAPLLVILDRTRFQSIFFVIMVFVKYFVPEDGDDHKHPNVFKVHGCASISALTLGLLKKSFPVEGNYHFRFLTSVPGANAKVWLDVMDDTAALPQAEGNEIFAKVSRIGVQRSNIVQQAPSSSSVPTRLVRQGSGSSPTAASDHATRRDSFGNPGGTNDRTTSSDSTNSGNGNARRNSERLISFTEESPVKADFTRAPSGGEEGLLDFGSSDDQDLNAAAAVSSGSHNDLFSLDSSTISPVPLSPMPSSNGGMNAFGQNGSGNGLNGIGTHQHSANPMGGGGGGGNAMRQQGMGMQGMSQQGMGMQSMGQQGMGMQNMGSMPHPNQLNSMNQQQKQNAFGGLDLGLRSNGLNGANGNSSQQGRPYR